MRDVEVHFEQFLQLAGLGHDKALIAWGGFYFRRGDSPYRVLVDGRPWGEGELHDWSVEQATLVLAGGRYDNRFRTFPSSDVAVPVTFAVLATSGWASWMGALTARGSC